MKRSFLKEKLMLEDITKVQCIVKMPPPYGGYNIYIKDRHLPIKLPGSGYKEVVRKLMEEISGKILTKKPKIKKNI